jgi:hypothetical protein
LKKIFSLRNVLALLGALVIGALGSGIWDTLFRPLFTWIGNALLNVATLGKQSLIDNIYAEVAKGSYERAATATFEFLMTTFCVLSLALPTSWFFFIPIARRIRDVYPHELENDEYDKSGRAFYDRLIRVLPRFILASLIIECLLVGLLSIITARQNYIIRATNFLEQSQRIVAPVQSADERLLTTSMVARMRSKADFDKVVSELRSVAKANKLDLPNFDEY